MKREDVPVRKWHHPQTRWKNWIRNTRLPLVIKMKMPAQKTLSNALCLPKLLLQFQQKEMSFSLLPLHFRALRASIHLFLFYWMLHFIYKAYKHRGVYIRPPVKSKSLCWCFLLLWCPIKPHNSQQLQQRKANRLKAVYGIKREKICCISRGSQLSVNIFDM